METLRTPENADTGPDDLLRLIEAGDAIDILSEKYTGCFADLMKYELVEIQGEKLQLTEKGRQARRSGVKNFMKPIVAEKYPTQKVPVSVDLKPEARNNSFLVILFFLLFSLLAIITLINT